MATTRYPTDGSRLKDAWDAAQKHTAATDETVRLANTGDNPVYWEVNSGTTPTFGISDGHPLAPGDGIPIKLTAGETLWFAGYDKVSLGVWA